MEVISHVRKGNTTRLLFKDETDDLCRLDVGVDKDGELLALLFYDNKEQRDPEGLANFNYVATIRDDGLGPKMDKVISLVPSRINKFRYVNVPKGQDALSDFLYEFISDVSVIQEQS